MNKRLVQTMLAAFFAVAIGSSLIWVVLGCPATGIDDADIFFVYARHLVDGHGFVYNIGGERVEGFTSMLWTLVCAGFFRLFQHIEIPLYCLNVLLGMVTVWACLHRARKPMVFLLVLAAVPAWFAWCQVTLLETGLWCMLLTLLVLAVAERRTVHAALLLPLLVFTRPESMLWGAWLILVLGTTVVLKDGWRKGSKIAALPSIAFAGALLALVAFRMVYFGYPVPNTYYAKVSPNLLYDLRNGTGYLLAYLFTNPAVSLVAAAWVWVLVRGMRRWREGFDSSTVIALCLLPGIGIPVLVGGDHFGGFRFYEPIWPLLCLLAANEADPLLEKIKPLHARILLWMLVMIGWLLFPLTAHLKHEFRIAREGRDTGDALIVMFHELDAYPTVATITAGGSKYTYPGTVLDLMGLNATEMAHMPGQRTGYKNHTAFNRDLFYRWHPDILLCGEDPEFDYKVLKGLPDEDRFKRMYIKLELQRNGRSVDAYYSHAFLEQVH